MKDKVKQIIKFDSESSKVDFKKEQYELGKNPSKNEILKDISAFANHPSDEDKFIIIGIKDDNGSKQVFSIQNIIDDAQYQQFIQDNIEPKINFEYKELEYENKRIAYFRIFENINRPYLFKKNIINTLSSKTEYKYGDGFVRTGSSSKKIGREELDEILKSQNKHKDRKFDIEINPIAALPDDKKISKYNIKYLDIEIINTSNKSIDIDVEMEFIINDKKKYNLISEWDFKREMEEEENRKREKTHLFYLNVPSVIVPNINVNVIESSNKFIVERNAIKNKTAITLKQNSQENDVFCQSLLLLTNDVYQIPATVIIRSDDFIDGPIRKEIIFKP